MSAIVTLTMNPAIDKSSGIDHVIPEKKLRCDPPRFYPGGGGINVSRVLKELDVASVAVYPAGGPTGEMLTTLLKKARIDCLPVNVEGWTRENLTITEGSSGQQYRFGMPGAKLSGKEWKKCAQRVSSLKPYPDYLVVSGSLPPGVPDDFYGDLATGAKKKSSRMILDTSGKALQLAAKAGVYLIKPNMHELETLGGKTIKDESDQEEVARGVIRKYGCEVIVVSLGAAGALLVTDAETIRLRAPSVLIKSKVGAGDSMVAGIVFGLIKGYSVRDAVTFGVAAGAAAVMTPGTELCRREDVQRLYNAMKKEGSVSQS